MPSITDFLAKFDRPTKAGGQWLVRCPAHEDRKASLTVTEGEDGRIVLHCHAGCDPKAILDRLGLVWSDLFVEARAPRREVATYDYRDRDGRLLYQVVRFEPKDFRQRRPNGAGGWVWNLT